MIAPLFHELKIKPILVVLGLLISIVVYLLAIFIEKEVWMYSVILGGLIMIAFGLAFLYLIRRQQKTFRKKGHA